jgi:hypothetical protein
VRTSTTQPPWPRARWCREGLLGSPRIHPRDGPSGASDPPGGRAEYRPPHGDGPTLDDLCVAYSAPIPALGVQDEATRWRVRQALIRHLADLDRPVPGLAQDYRVRHLASDLALGPQVDWPALYRAGRAQLDEGASR